MSSIDQSFSGRIDPEEFPLIIQITPAKALTQALTIIRDQDNQLVQITRSSGLEFIVENDESSITAAFRPWEFHFFHCIQEVSPSKVDVGSVLSFLLTAPEDEIICIFLNQVAPGHLFFGYAISPPTSDTLFKVKLTKECNFQNSCVKRYTYLYETSVPSMVVDQMIEQLLDLKAKAEDPSVILRAKNDDVSFAIEFKNGGERSWEFQANHVHEVFEDIDIECDPFVEVTDLDFLRQTSLLKADASLWLVEILDPPEILVVFRMLLSNCGELIYKKRWSIAQDNQNESASQIKGWTMSGACCSVLRS